MSPGAVIKLGRSWGRLDEVTHSRNPPFCGVAVELEVCRGRADRDERQVLASYDTDTIKAASYAVTIEQGGGSPDGTPHSAPVYAGKLVETVPPR